MGNAGQACTKRSGEGAPPDMAEFRRMSHEYTWDPFSHTTVKHPSPYKVQTEPHHLTQKDRARNVMEETQHRRQQQQARSHTEEKRQHAAFYDSVKNQREDSVYFQPANEQGLETLLGHWRTTQNPVMSEWPEIDRKKAHLAIKYA